jgi:hypothetical protein
VSNCGLRADTGRPGLTHHDGRRYLLQAEAQKR